MSLVVDEHREIVSDRARLSAYEKAIAETVRPGDVVLDLGSGTGILGLLACRAGASRVYSIEESGMIELGRAIARANDFADRMQFVKGFSTRVDLPEKVDVVVCDQMGRFGFEAGVWRFFHDARERFLKPGGKLVPRRVDLLVAAVERAETWNQVEFWNSQPAGFDFHPARSWALNTGYPVKLCADELLSEAALVCSFRLTDPLKSVLRGEVRIPVRRAGLLHGIGGWFSAALSESVSMTNSPLSSDSISRRNAFFPLDGPVTVSPGDCIHVSMHINPGEVMVSWKVEIRGGPSGTLKGRFSHSTLLGMLLAREDLERMRPDTSPRLSPWGKARRSILELCDGRRSLAEIEKQVYERHHNLFREPGEAAAFVSEVVTRYAE